MRVVLDTVVFVRALINPKSRWGRLLFALSDRFTPVLSPAILQEILEVLYRPLLRERFPQMASLPELHEVLRILDMAEAVEPTVRLRVCRDPNDDKFLECAVAGEAEYIISEDQDLLTLKEFQGVKVLSVAEFIGFLEGQEEQSTSSMGERTTD